MNIRITAYLDGKTSDFGYKFVVLKGFTNWRAYRSIKGFKRFLNAFGLEIDPSKTELHDYRHIGLGHCITMVCKKKTVVDEFGGFYSLDEVPSGATPFIDICNGNYVQCYILDEGSKVTVYKPNPNSKDVYIPFDHFACDRLYG